ncbi:MAG: tetratricopeptide repeat protein [Nitrospinae bacterium]|nr:tetratricopeptide repeat protein [Nitrospinota bacterium]
MRRHLWLLALLVIILSLGPFGPLQPIHAAEEEPASRPDPQAKKALEYFRFGLGASRAGSYERAIKWFEDSERLKPGFAPVYLSLGYAYEKVGRLAEAETASREAIRLQPALSGAHVNLGNVLKALGRLAEAERAYQEAIRLDPKLSRGHNNLAWLWVSSSDPAFYHPKEALAHAQEAVRLTERMDAGPLDTLAEVHYALGRCLKAIWTEEEAIAEAPGNAAYKASLKRFKLCRDAMWAARDGDVAKARRRWREILALSSEDWKAREELSRLR